jgi:quercetin dioxygenase-like cupin family protein
MAVKYELQLSMTNEIIRVGQIEIRFLLEAGDTNGAVAMFEFAVPAGATVPLPHSHKHYDETIYGVEGVITFTVAGKPVDIGPGETCFIPRGAVHGFNNLTQTDAKGLVVITPARLGSEFFKDAAAIVNAGGPPDVEKLKAVMTKHGLVPALPPASSRWEHVGKVTQRACSQASCL